MEGVQYVEMREIKEVEWGEEWEREKRGGDQNVC
jgi:hypothetical protein